RPRHLIAVMLVFFFCSSAHAEMETRYTLKYLFAIDGKATGAKFTSVSRIYIDEFSNEIYLMDTGRVVITDKQGYPIYHFPLFKPGEIPDVNAEGMAIDSNNRILIGGGKGIVSFDYRGRYKGVIPITGISSKDQFGIQSMAVDAEGNIHIGTGGAGARVIKLDPQGRFISEIKSEDRFINVRGLSVLEDGSYTLVDPAKFQVVRLAKDGTTLAQFGMVSSLMGGFSMPIDLAIDKNKERIFVSDVNRLMVIMFDMQGKPLYEFGGPQLFRGPVAIAIDRNSRIYVSDAGLVRVFEIIEEQAPVMAKKLLPELEPEPVPIPEPEEEETRQAVAQVQKIVEEEARLLPVFFSTDSAILKPEAKDALEKDAKWLVRKPDVKVNVRGYSDKRGGAAYNKKLSQKRAEAVMSYLKTIGISWDRMTVVPMGVEETGLTEEAMQQARRVDFLIKEEEKIAPVPQPPAQAPAEAAPPKDQKPPEPADGKEAVPPQKAPEDSGAKGSEGIDIEPVTPKQDAPAAPKDAPPEGNKGQ
ncbi:MAG: OmpA family protein, partial [Deltaproteobacteria bacterium]|nr:OmpA family protein [Deltaproteobacteria bacterium]